MRFQVYSHKTTKRSLTVVGLFFYGYCLLKIAFLLVRFLGRKNMTSRLISLRSSAVHCTAVVSVTWNCFFSRLLVQSSDFCDQILRFLKIDSGDTDYGVFL